MKNNKFHAFNLNNLFDSYFNLFYQIKHENRPKWSQEFNHKDMK